MLEIRYNETTRELTGWWASRHGGHEVKLAGRPGEAIATLDTPIPDKPLEAWLYDGEKLVANPAYAPPLDERVRATELLANSPDVITQPEIWELMRIFGRLLNIPA